jgi:hypothetical protein
MGSTILPHHHQKAPLLSVIEVLGENLPHLARLSATFVCISQSPPRPNRLPARQTRVGACADEFIRRFLLHVLPPRFVKIRYFGFLFHRDKHRNIALMQDLLGTQAVTAAAVVENLQQIMPRLTGIDSQC